jgi:hypothetical protein
VRGVRNFLLDLGMADMPSDNSSLRRVLFHTLDGAEKRAASRLAAAAASMDTKSAPDA